MIECCVRFAESHQRLTERQSYESPWATTGVAYISHPAVNLALTVVHSLKTLERVAKAIYYFSTSILSSLEVVFTKGAKKELNQLCIKQWVGLGINLYGAVLSLGFTIVNIAVGVQGLLAIKRATKNQVYLIRQQAVLDREIPLAHESFSDELEKRLLRS